MNSSPNAIKQLDATFGSRRGAILQQNPLSAHLPEITVSLTLYQLCVGPDPIDVVHTFEAMSKRIYFNFIWHEFVAKYHNTVGCNFWQPQGSPFTAKFGNGTPPKNKSVTDSLPSRRGPRPNRWSAHLGRNVEDQ